MNIDVGIIMGSRSDWETMRHATETLDGWAFTTKCKSSPHTARPTCCSSTPNARPNVALKVIIAGAGGAAHLPGMAASKTRLPVLGVPVQSKALNGMDSLLSIAQMPAGIPVGCMAIGRAGAVNAALLAAAMLANDDAGIARRLMPSARTRPKRFWADSDPTQ